MPRSDSLGVAVLVVVLVVLGIACVAGCVPRQNSSVTGTSVVQESTSTRVAPRPSATPAPLIIGLADGDLVAYDPQDETKRVVVQNVGDGGSLSVSPDKTWLAIEEHRRWDGLDTTEIVFVNTTNWRTWRLSEQARRELHVTPLGWQGDAAYFEDDGAFSNVPEIGRYALDLTTGAVRKVSDAAPPQNWRSVRAEWPLGMPVPDPESPDQDQVQFDDFWSFGGLDVSRDGEWAVAWLQPNWAAPIDGELFPTYLLDRAGGYSLLPLRRPVVFAETLGLDL